MGSYRNAPATWADVTNMLENMREEDREEATCLGITVRRALWRSYRNSFFQKAHFVDNELAAITAIGGTLLGGIGYPWVVTTHVVDRAPLTYFRECRRGIHSMLLVFPRLESVIGANHHKALKFFEMMGFTIIPAQEGSLFCRVVMERENVSRETIGAR